MVVPEMHPREVVFAPVFSGTVVLPPKFCLNWRSDHSVQGVETKARRELKPR